MFSILNEVLQKLEDGSPKAKLIFDFIIRLFQNKNDKSIVMRCFLRDFVGANDSGRFYNFIVMSNTSRISDIEPTEETFLT